MDRKYSCEDCHKELTQTGPGKLRKVCPDCRALRVARLKKEGEPARARDGRKPRAQGAGGGLGELLKARVHELVEAELAATAKPEFERAVEAYLAERLDERIDARVEAKLKEALGK